MPCNNTNVLFRDPNRDAGSCSLASFTVPQPITHFHRSFHRKYLLPCVVALAVNTTGVVASLFMNETLNSKSRNHQQQSTEPQTLVPSSTNDQHDHRADQGQSATSLPQVPSLGYLTDQDPEVMPLFRAFFHESCINHIDLMETSSFLVSANNLRFPWRVGQ